jgi:hypothetical protein
MTTRYRANEMAAADTISGKLQRHCLRIIVEHRAAGPDSIPTSVRFVYYELVQASIISKHATGARRPDSNVSDALMQLRRIGLVAWDEIADETRELLQWVYANSVADYVMDRVDVARIDAWDGEPPPRILCESRSLGGVLRSLSQRYLALLAATNGQVGGFLHTDVAPALVPGQRVLYLGDFDWQAGQIEANTRRVLEKLIGGELNWERLALTEEQVNRRHLPRIRKADRRYKPVRYHDAVETEALHQSVIVDIVRRRLDQLLPEPIADVLARQDRQRRKVRAVLTRLRL